MNEPQQGRGQGQQQRQQQGSGQAESQSNPPGRPGAEQGGAGLWGNDAPRMRQPLAGSEPGNPDTQDMQSQPGGPLAGNQPQAIDNPTGAATLKHDQYELNQPQNMHKRDAEDERRVREQASLQDDGDRGFGYGADGDTEMQDAPDASEGKPAKPDPPAG